MTEDARWIQRELQMRDKTFDRAVQVRSFLSGISESQATYHEELLDIIYRQKDMIDYLLKRNKLDSEPSLINHDVTED